MKTIDPKNGPLAQFIGCYYYQTVWEDYSTESDIWDDFLKSNTKEHVSALVEDIDRVAQAPQVNLSPLMEEIVGEFGGISFDSPADFMTWLHKVRDYFVEKLN